MSDNKAKASKAPADVEEEVVETEASSVSRVKDEHQDDDK